MKFKKFGKHGFQVTSFKGNERVMFVPALFFLCLGLLAIVAPKFVLFLVASFFLFIGAVAAFLAWKFIQMRRKFESVVKDLSGKIVVQSSREHSPFEFEDEIVVEESKKKIVFH